MYCQTCGNQNPDSANYCTHDGASLQKGSSKFTYNKKQSSYCSDCGSAIGATDNYCQACGSIQYVVTSQGASSIQIPAFGGSSKEERFFSSIKLPKISLATLKNALIPTLVSLVVLFILSFIGYKLYGEPINTFFEEDVASEMNYMLEEVAYYFDEDEPEIPNKLVGITDMLMLSHMQEASLEVSVKGEVWDEKVKFSSGIGFNLGLFIILLIPLLSLFIGGIVASQSNRNENISEKFSKALSIAFVYAAILSIISLFSGFGEKWSFSEDDVEAAMKIGIDYSFIGVFIKAFVFGTVFSMLGLLFAKTYTKTTGHLANEIKLGEALHQAFATVWRGLLIMVFILFGYALTSEGEFFEEVSYEFADSPVIGDVFAEVPTLMEESKPVFATQFGYYAWTMAHFTPISVDFKYADIGNEDLKGELTYSSFSAFGFDSNDKEANKYTKEYFEEENYKTPLFLKLSFLIPLLLFVWAGMRLAQRSSNPIVASVQFSVFYALIMSFLASILVLGLSLNVEGDFMGMEENDASAFLNIGFFSIFFSSLLFSFVGAYGGTWVQKLLKG